MNEVDVAIVGAGAAGLSLAARLTDPAHGPAAPSVALVDPGPSTGPGPRTWCFWEPEGGAYDEAASAVWRRLRVVAADGTVVEGDPAPFRYKMLRSDRFEELLGSWFAGRPRLRRVTAAVTSVEDLPGGAAVHGLAPGGGAVSLRSRWVFDSRPLPALPPARTTLLQHFRGWFVRTGHDAFDPGAATLMDFRTPRPAHGLSFGYVLPWSAREALVEYTEFSRAPLEEHEYEAALAHYTGEVLGLGPFSVTGTEQGVVPMTDGAFPRRAGRHVFRIGSAGGATRPSTGYTFSAVQRQAAAIEAACLAGRVPVPPRPHRLRHRVMDAVLLRALDTGRVEGAAYFERLFRNNPLPRLLRFLDGASGPREEAAIGFSTPVAPMLHTLAELPLLRRTPAGPTTGRAGVPPR
ncbi:lycopene cyclase [Streptomyces sp. SCUT-3]|uniref:lycopene cyclase family protein n=2 Tax=unclassified Streptomyces TaxID=2593676 RepID=UPI0015FBEB0E|nr:lycopene cyclase family protein [Streptomyces sp. SCUT-3]QMV24526.1 lycopene cyclase [Streptomyces sp. SCUT-3]